MLDDRREPTFAAEGRSFQGEPPAAARSRRAPSAAFVVVAVLLLAAAGGGWWWWSRAAATFPPAVQPPATASATPPTVPPAPEPEPAALLPAPDAEVVKADDIQASLIQWLGVDAVARFLQTTDFPRRFVATVDNLGREHAAPSLWPVQASPGRFAVEGGDASTTIAAENALRYSPFVAFAGSVDAARAVDLYWRMHPSLEQAWRDLGFARRPLHARVIEVVDLLLATPEPAQAPKVTLTEVKGSTPSTRPWTRYEYEDAQYERLAAGQKILLRMGPDQRKVLKAKLQEIRRELVRVSAGGEAHPRP